jgi:ATP-dependent RNA helicase RhlE
MTPQPHSHHEGFNNLGIAPKLLEILAHHKFVTPTPIQVQAIPVAVEGKDVIGIAQTGTGKTLAFGLPTLQRLARSGGRALILLPTRELALQVEETMLKIGRPAGLRTAILIGGASMRPQIDSLRRNPHVIVATPGRLIDHLDQKILTLNEVKVLILDEADRMLDMGFLPQITRILRQVPRERQTMLFSATMPEDIVRIAAEHMKLPVRVEVARAGTSADNVSQELFVVKKEDKTRLLEKLLGEVRGSVLVFTRTKFGAKKLARIVKSMGHASSDIHSDRSLAQRKEALAGFKSGKYRVLVATDIAARGIDVTGIELVLNFDVPENPEDYVHRIGRTGRAGLSGRAITFAMPDQGRDVRDIERLTRKMLTISKMPELPPHRAVAFTPTATAFGRPQHGRSSHQSRPQYGRSQQGGRPQYGARAQHGRPSYGGQRRSSDQAARPAAPFVPRSERRPSQIGKIEGNFPGLDDAN